MPLETIGFGWRSHLAALHWLGLLYRRPAQVQARWRNMPRIVALRSGLFLLLHAQVYAILWRVLLFLMLGDHRLDALDLASGGGAPSNLLRGLGWTSPAGSPRHAPIIYLGILP